MNTLKDLEKVIYLKKGGYDCSEEESSIIKTILKGLIQNFPLEYTEIIEEIETN